MAGAEGRNPAEGVEREVFHPCFWRIFRRIQDQGRNVIPGRFDSTPCSEGVAENPGEFDLKMSP